MPIRVFQVIIGRDKLPLFGKRKRGIAPVPKGGMSPRSPHRRQFCGKIDSGGRLGTLGILSNSKRPNRHDPVRTYPRVELPRGFPHFAIAHSPICPRCQPAENFDEAIASIFAGDRSG